MECGSTLEKDADKIVRCDLKLYRYKYVKSISLKYPGVYTDVRQYYHWIQSKVDQVEEEKMDDEAPKHFTTEEEDISGSTSSRGHPTLGSNTDISLFLVFVPLIISIVMFS